MPLMHTVTVWVRVWLVLKDETEQGDVAAHSEVESLLVYHWRRG